MALDKDIHSAFADVVGEENICDDPAMMPAYFKTDFAAVIMPKNTAEVQAVVKLCNKYKLQFRPICTGWTGVFPPGIVLIDLRRMNQIIEINEKNMYAVVEPYVTSAQLQAELFKRGLNTNIKGAGLAVLGHAAGPRSPGPVHGGRRPQPSGRRMGHAGRRDGQAGFLGIDRTSGSAATGRARPCGRIISERRAAQLHAGRVHQGGDEALPLGRAGTGTRSKGNSPKYTLAEKPDNMMAPLLQLPHLEKMWQAEIKIGESRDRHGAHGLQRRHGRRQHHHLQRRRRGHVPAASTKRCRAPASS